MLIPNAGVLCMADLESVSEEVFERTMAVNVKGPMFLAQVSFFFVFCVWFGGWVEVFEGGERLGLRLVDADFGLV